MFLNTEDASSQDVQIWADGFLYKQFAAGLDNELNPGFARLMQSDGWKDIYIVNALTWQPVGWYAAEGAVEFHYTPDPQGPDIYEIRPFLGQKLIFNRFIRAIHLDKPYFYTRLDQRFLWYPEDGTQESKTRIRPRIGGRFILNSDALNIKAIYVPFFLEYFIDLNGEAKERFAYRNRFSAGVGYVINSRWRAELDYYIGRSRNSAEDDFVKTDMSFQIQIKYFLQYQTY